MAGIYDFVTRNQDYIAPHDLTLTVADGYPNSSAVGQERFGQQHSGRSRGRAYWRARDPFFTATNWLRSRRILAAFFDLNSSTQTRIVSSLAVISSAGSFVFGSWGAEPAFINRIFTALTLASL
jgi:hypothetical protein